MFQGEILKKNGKMLVNHHQFLPPQFIREVFKIVPLAVQVAYSRGCRDSYNQLISWGAQFIVTMFLGVRGNETLAAMKNTELQIFDDETYNFRYYRGASRGPTKNRYNDLEEMTDHGIIPFFQLTPDFNPGQIISEYLKMINLNGAKNNFLLLPRSKSLSYRNVL